MTKTALAVSLLALAGAVHAQPNLPVQPGPDSVERRQILQKLTACLAKARPRWARQTLSYPYLHDKQAFATAEAFSGRDNCVRGDNVDVTFRTSALVGGLAEYFVRPVIGRADLARLTTTMTAIKPMNASEDFALCLAARDPAAARDLALAAVGSAAEASFARKLAAEAGPCVSEGVQLSVDVQSLRALMSVALYRGTDVSSP